MVYCNVSMTHNIPCKNLGIFQPSSHTIVSTPEKSLSIISRAQCHWISTKVRCGPDSFQKVTVTVLKVVASLLTNFLQHCYTVSTKKMRNEKKMTSQNTQSMFFWVMGMKKVLAAVCCSGVTPFSSSTPPNLVMFLRGTLAKWRACR